MAFKDLLNLKKTMKELEEAESAPDYELKDKEDPKEYSLFERAALDIATLVAPEAASNEETYFKIGDEYTKTLFIHTYPPLVDDNWLREILRFQHAIDVAFYIQPLPIKDFLKKLRQQAGHDEAAITKQSEDGVIPDKRREARWRDTQQFITAIEEDVTKPFQIMVALTVRAHTEKDLNRITEELERRMTIVTTRQTRWRHKQGFNTTMPVMNNELQEMQTIRSMHTHGIMSMFPFTASDITHENGVLVGISQISGSPIILNRFLSDKVPSPNTAILGQSGSGKSFFAKLEMGRWAMQGVPTIVMDPSGEYIPLAYGLGGVNIEISLDSESVINPLDFSNAIRPGHNALREKIGFMIELMRVMLKTEGNSGVVFDAYTATYIENALKEVYRLYGYQVEDIESQQGATPEQMPTLSQVVHMLERIQKSNRDQDLQARAKPLLAALRTFIEDGHLAPLFDRRTTVNLNSHFINFNYSNLANQYRGMAMHLVLEFLRTSFFNERQRESGQHRLFYVDEAQILMESPETAKFLNYTARTCRKYGIGLTVMTQDVNVFVQHQDGTPNPLGQGILANCSITVLLGQKTTEKDSLIRAYELNEQELVRLFGAARGEGLIFVGGERAWFNSMNMASPVEYEMMTTDMSERAEIAQRDRASLEEANDDTGRILHASDIYEEEEDAYPDDNPFANPFS